MALVEAADTPGKKRRGIRLKWWAAAACLCLAAAGVLALFGGGPDGGEEARPVLQWSEGWEAESYFQHCDGPDEGMSTSGSMDSSAIPYAHQRDFSGQRGLLEAQGVIPVMDTHPLCDLYVCYNEDGSVFSVNISWHRRGEREDYSHLTLIAGYREVEQIQDSISVELDEDGNIVQPCVTVTERDGVRIVAEGAEHRGKAITYQNERGWYQITGSSNDSRASVVELLDWFWEHPLDFGLFPMEAGDHWEYAQLADYPLAFSDCLPDFAAFGFYDTQALLVLKNGRPVTFEGHYVAHVDEALVKADDYCDVPGHTTMHWCVKAEPDYYDVQRSMGDVSRLTEELVAAELEKESSVAFMCRGNWVVVFPSDAAEAWALIRSLQQG